MTGFKHGRFPVARLMPFLCLLLLTGCQAFLTPQVQQQRFQQALAEGEFRDAQRYLLLGVDSWDKGTLKALDADYHKSVATSKKAAMAKTKQLLDKGEWAEALELLENLAAELPEEMDLQSSYQRLKLAKQLRIDDLTIQLAQTQAQNILDQIHLLEAIEKTEGRSLFSDSQVNRLYKQQQDLVNILLECADKALSNKNIAQAEYCLQPIAEIVSKDQRQRFDALQKHLLSQTLTKKGKAVVTAAPAVAKDDEGLRKYRLKQQYLDSVKAGWWEKARQQMNALSELYPLDVDIQVWRVDLERQVAEYIDWQLRYGQLLYSKGDITQALDIWRQAASLAPGDNLLKAHIERAEKFLTKLNTLEP